MMGDNLLINFNPTLFFQTYIQFEREILIARNMIYL